jgi:hypothetical protein
MPHSPHPTQQTKKAGENALQLKIEQLKIMIHFNGRGGARQLRKENLPKMCLGNIMLP